MQTWPNWLVTCEVSHKLPQVKPGFFVENRPSKDPATKNLLQIESQERVLWELMGNQEKNFDGSVAKPEVGLESGVVRIMHKGTPTRLTFVLLLEL